MFDMKKLIFAALIFSSASLFAQQKEGRVVYKRTFQLPARMFQDNPDAAKRIPRSRENYYELLFSNNQSLMQNLPDANEAGDVTVNSPGGVSVFRMNTNEVSLVDLNAKTRTDYREMFDRTYQVSDTLQKLNWKLTDERKVILNHPVFKATAQRISMRPRVTMENGVMKRTEMPDTAQVVAWFTTDIPVSAGPDLAGQLPGLILQLVIGDNQMVYEATEISDKVNISKIKLPKGGKKMTAAEFRTEQNNLMEEMRKRMPANGNGGMRMEIRN